MDTSVLSKEEDPPKDEKTLRKMLTNALETLKKGNYTEGLAQLDEIIDCGSSNFNFLATVYMWYGRVCRHLGQFEKAHSYLQYEIQMYRFTNNLEKSYDAYRRLISLLTKMRKIQKAKRSAHDFIEFAKDENNSELVIKGRIMLLNMLLSESERQELRDEEKRELLNDAILQIGECKTSLEEVTPSPIEGIDVKAAEAKYKAICGEDLDALELYKECIAAYHELQDFESIHKCYFSMAHRCHKIVVCRVDNLRSAIYYANKCKDTRYAVDYSINLSKTLRLNGNVHEAYDMAKDCLKMSRELNSTAMIINSTEVLIDALIGLKKNEKAAYFLVFGSVLAIAKNDEKQLKEFYEMIDGLMTEMKKMTEEGAEAEITIDGTDDPLEIGNGDSAEPIVIKLEHTTNLETWKVTIAGIVENKKEKKIEEKKEEKEVDFFEFLAKMNARMDDQRTELPAIGFVRPRPVSSMSKGKKAKSYRFLPGLRISMPKLNEMKMDKKFNKILKLRKNKSKLSVNSDSQNDHDTETICSNSDLASLESVSLNKENMEATSQVNRSM